MRHAPQSLAKAASERIRSGLSPKTINIAAAVSAPYGEALPEGGRRLGGESGEVSIMRGDFVGEGELVTGACASRMRRACREDPVAVPHSG